MTRMTGWEEFVERAIPTPAGPVLVKPGETVLIVVASSPSECFVATQYLLAKRNESPDE